MPNIPGGYAPPGVYTQTNFDNPIQSGQVATTLPVLIGTGNETLSETNLGLIRGSSSTVDQRVVDEDETGRAVVSEGPIALGAFNGAITKLQVKNYPLVTGDGTGTTATDTNSVTVTVNGTPTVVLGIDGVNGVLELAAAPKASDVVRVTYFFNRADTLTTDDVSNQVTAGAAVLQGAVGQPAAGFSITAGDTFNITVNGSAEQVFTFGATGFFTAASVVAALNSDLVGVVASTFVNNFGENAVALTSSQSLVVGAGTANGTLGFNQGQATNRNATFRVFNTPIVDGTNGGLTTTDPSNVTVKVNNVQVIPTAVDGATGSVTLSVAPADGSIVTVQYHFNTWQDTFDYLAHIGVSNISQVGLAPGRTDFLDGVSWILKDDVIVWGTSSLVSAGSSSPGASPFGETQVSTTLVDNRMYLAETSSVVDSSVFPAVESRTRFVLPEQPTTGNGRNNPLGTSFDSVANGRFDLPTYNPNLVSASVGFDLADAVNRGTVEVTAVDPTTNTITLANPVVEGEKVFATFYYSTMVDETYTLACQVDGVSGVGSYSLTNSSGNNIFAASFGSKSAGLATIPVEFPSGSEVFPDALLATPSDTSNFVGPVDELVTVQFADTDETPAKYTAPGEGPFYFVDANSDSLTISGSGPFTVDLAEPFDASIPGFFALLAGEEISYDPDASSQSYTVVAGVNDSVTLNVDGDAITGTVTPGAAKTVQDYVNALNTAALSVNPSLAGGTEFTDGHEILLNKYDKFRINYVNIDTPGGSDAFDVQVSAGAYATAALLAAEVNTQILAGATPGSDVANGVLVASADSQGRIVFTLDQANISNPTDAVYVEFLRHSVTIADNQNFFNLVGIASANAAGENGSKLRGGAGAVASRFTVAATSGRLNHDRIILRNRIWVGQRVPSVTTNAGVRFQSALSQCKLEVVSGTGLSNCGLKSGDSGEAGFSATLNPPTLFGEVGWSGGFASSDCLAQVTFFDGTGAEAQNDTLTLRFGSEVRTVSFTSSALGTQTSISAVADDINTAISGLGLAFADGGAVISISSLSTKPEGALSILPDTANTLLGFSALGESASRSEVSVKRVVSALYNSGGAGLVSLSDLMASFPGTSSGEIADEMLFQALQDDAGNHSLFIQNRTLGTSSQIGIVDDTALRSGTNFLAKAGDSAIGENAAVGYFVTSSNPAGSGSANVSKFNGGPGQDGEIGQTYTDLVTGLRFTVLPRSGGAAYPTGQSFTLNVGSTVTTNANVPVLLPGVELLVSNTLGVSVGDTATVETFDKSGDEPSIGQVYYASYTYTKQNYSTRIFSRLSDVEEAFGPVSPNNPLSLGAYLMFLNGAVQIGIKQVQKDAGSNNASESSFIAAIDSLEGNLPGNVIPGVLVPLTPATSTLLNYLSIHCDVQSSIRYKSERTAILGFAAGTQPEQAGLLAKATKSSRVRVVYPDIATVPITDALGVRTDYLVDGRYMAAATAANRVAPSRDVASPWTGAQLVGFSSLGRSLDAVEANQVAVNGVTILEDRAPFLRVRQGFTTDMTNVLTKTPTVIQIADLVQQASRAALEPYIGTKLIGSVTGSMETDLSRVFKRLKKAQIISNYTGISVKVDPNDPTSINVEAFYQPVFPLLYIVLSFNVRTSL